MNKAHKVDKEIKFLIIIIMISIIFGVLIVKVMYSIEIANRNDRASERLEDITKAGYDECTLYGNDLFVSEGKLYMYKYDADGQVHIFYINDVAEK